MGQASILTLAIQLVAGICAGLVVVVLAACSAKADEPTAKAAVCIGDSISLRLAPYLDCENLAVGGETTSEVRFRWAKTANFPTVYLHAGINDLSEGIEFERSTENYRFFASEAKRRGQTLIIDNIGPDLGPWFDAKAQAKGAALNAWLSGEFSREYPEVKVNDYLGWASPDRSFRTERRGMFADALHPNSRGAKEWAGIIRRTSPQG